VGLLIIGSSISLGIDDQFLQLKSTRRKSIKMRTAAARLNRRNERKRSASRSAISGVATLREKAKRRSDVVRIRKRKNGIRRKPKRNERRRKEIQTRSGRNARDANARSARRKRKGSIGPDLRIGRNQKKRRRSARIDRRCL
jgi:hypothetical protein